MTGEIIELREHGQVVCALVRAADERLAVLTEHGREMRLPAARVLHHTGETLASDLPPEECCARLRDFARRAEALRDAVDLTALWEQVVDAEGPHPLDALARRALAADGPRERSATLRALAADQQLFRQARGGFTARTRDEVTRAREEAARRALEAEQRTALAAWLAAADGSTTTGPPDGAGRWIEQLVEYVTSGTDVRPPGDLTELLDRAGLPPERITTGAVFALLVRAGVLAEDENLLLRKYGRELEFPAPVTAAAAAAAQAGPAGADRREVPPGSPVVSIDDPETTEIDDAVQYLGPGADGGWRVAVYIADPDALVPAGGQVDEEAFRRATTVYLPDRRLPMLPACLADDAASLRAGQARPALAFTLEIAPDGELVGAELDLARVTVRERLSFDEVAERLAAGDPDLNVLLACAEARRRHRHGRGAYLLSQPEVFPRVDTETGAVTLKRYSPATAPTRLVAELMIAANVAAARFCEARRIPAPFRGQRRQRSAPPPPDPAAPYDPVQLQQMLRALERTTVALSPQPHAGLGLDAYLQVTSPVRRYSDLLVHRQIKAALAGAPLPYGPAELLARCRESEQRAGEARQIEAWAREYYLLKYLRERRGEQVRAVVLRRLDDRVLVELTEYAHRATFRPAHPVEVGERLALEVLDAQPRAGRLELAETR